jgi:hypothetical protein
MRGEGGGKGGGEGRGGEGRGKHLASRVENIELAQFAINHRRPLVPDMGVKSMQESS